MSLVAHRSSASDGDLLIPQSTVWANAGWTAVDLFPAPLAMVEDASPFLARSTDHGSIKRLDVSAAHNGGSLAVALRWKSRMHAEPRDLDQFVDGVAVLFPLARLASAMSMGSADAPVNGWLWRANRAQCLEIVGAGFASVRRLRMDETGDLAVAAVHDGEGWQVVFRRSLSAPDGHARFAAGQSLRIAFAAWDGGNAERSGRKSVSGEFADFELAR